MIKQGKGNWIALEKTKKKTICVVRGGCKTKVPEIRIALF